MKQVIKSNPELRHVLAHILCAIESLADGRPMSALEEIRSIEGSVFFYGPQEMEGFLREVQYEEESEVEETKEKAISQRL